MHLYPKGQVQLLQNNLCGMQRGTGSCNGGMLDHIVAAATAGSVQGTFGSSSSAGSGIGKYTKKCSLNDHTDKGNVTGFPGAHAAQHTQKNGENCDHIPNKGLNFQIQHDVTFLFVFIHDGFDTTICFLTLYYHNFWLL